MTVRAKCQSDFLLCVRDNNSSDSGRYKQSCLPLKIAGVVCRCCCIFFPVPSDFAAG